MIAKYNFLKPFQYRHSWLITLSILLFFNLSTRFSGVFLGDKDRLISGDLKFLFFWINVFIVISFTVSCYFKSMRIDRFNISKTKIFLIISVSFILRILLSSLGHNYDLESFEIVGDLVLKGDNFYAETDRYNYGPVWALLMSVFKYISTFNGIYHQQIFHALIVTVLFAGELLLAYQLLRSGYDWLSVLILLLNPLSIILIGHHSQFDILAISIAYAAFRQIKKDNVWIAVILMGLSYSIKHLMVFFPLILLFDNGIKLKNRLAFLTIPAMIFALSFIPYFEAFENIRKNVIGYQLNHGQTLIYKVCEIVIPRFASEYEFTTSIPLMNGYKPIWILTTLITGRYIQKHRPDMVFETYLIILVALSPAISEQYLLIPMTAVVLLRKSIFSWLYLAISTYYIAIVSNHNTAKYFGMKDLGLDLPQDWYSIGFAQIQLVLLALMLPILKNSTKKS